MTDWRWVKPEIVYAVHDRQLAEHVGLDGLRDPGAVESALARNHGFADGNKRAAWVIARLFLADNGLRLSFEAADAVRIIGRLLPEASARRNSRPGSGTG